jgi:hypothetical protein
VPVELLQFGGLLAVIAVVALLWFIFVYKARRTGEGDGTPRGENRGRDDRPIKKDDEDLPG